MKIKVIIKQAEKYKVNQIRNLLSQGYKLVQEYTIVEPAEPHEEIVVMNFDELQEEEE